MNRIENWSHATLTLDFAIDVINKIRYHYLDVQSMPVAKCTNYSSYPTLQRIISMHKQRSRKWCETFS